MNSPENSIPLGTTGNSSQSVPRTAFGLLATGAQEQVRQALFSLEKTQGAYGQWTFAFESGGSSSIEKNEIDETALVILLADLAFREWALTPTDLVALWPMIRRAAGFLIRNGPVNPHEKWEEDSAYSPFTVGAQIAALLAAADLADFNQEGPLGIYLREIADVWYDSIDRWMYLSEPDWCEKFKVHGYYVQSTSHETGGALALVRFGLRDANEKRITDTVQVIDGLLKVETPSGPIWYGSNDAIYAKDQPALHQGWVLPTGERAHYEIAAGRVDEAKTLLTALEAFANGGDFASDTALNAAYAEYLKLQRSLREGRVYDLPPQPVKRYLVDQTVSPHLIWRFNHKIRSMPEGKTLRIETLVPSVIRWSSDGWTTVQDYTTFDVGLGIHSADLTTQALTEGSQIQFTFFWPEAQQWEGKNFTVQVGTF